ncbi:MAG: CDP-alcohol phosphatidyltransferase family protein [Candidatus Micrarchaeota archaeon]
MLKSTKTAEKASSKLGSVLKFIPIDPNAITLLSVILAIMALGIVVLDQGFETIVASFILFIFAFFFDAVDGAVARAKNLVSIKGGFYDGIADRVVEFCLIATLILIYLKISGAYLLSYNMVLVLVSILFFGTCMTSFVKAYSEHQGILKNEEAKKLPGFLERAERSVLLLLAFLMLILGKMQFAEWDLYLVAALSILTFLQRFVLVANFKQKN